MTTSTWNTSALGEYAHIRGRSASTVPLRGYYDRFFWDTDDPARGRPGCAGRSSGRSDERAGRRRAVVTGGTKGAGAAVVAHLRSMGAHVTASGAQRR